MKMPFAPLSRVGCRNESEFAQNPDQRPLTWKGIQPDSQRNVSDASVGLAESSRYPDLISLDSLFWIWTHYATAKLRRGEIFEVLAHLNLIRRRPLASLIAKARGRPFTGVQRFEEQFPADVEPLGNTVAQYEKQSCLEALRNAADLYLNRQGALDRPAVNCRAVMP